MKPTLVTGATGFLGWHVARVLAEQGCRVRALARPSSAGIGIEGVERVTGDLRDAGSLERAVAGCGVVYHVAADYRLWARRPQELYESNVMGTRNMLEAARRAGVERVVVWPGDSSECLRGYSCRLSGLPQQHHIREYLYP
jgi:dihydroflavonol-4-reductase